MHEHLIPVLFDVVSDDHSSRSTAAAHVQDRLVAAGLVERHMGPAALIIESWYFGEHDLKHVDSNDRDAFATIPHDVLLSVLFPDQWQTLSDQGYLPPVE